MGNKHPRYDDDFYDWITAHRQVDVNMAYAMCEAMQDAWRAAKHTSALTKSTTSGQPDRCPTHGQYAGTNCTYCDYPPLFQQPDELAQGALDAIHALLDEGGIPRGTFADDHVRNLVVLYNQRGDHIAELEKQIKRESVDIEIAARIIEPSLMGQSGNYSESAAEAARKKARQIAEAWELRCNGIEDREGK